MRESRLSPAVRSIAVAACVAAALFVVLAIPAPAPSIATGALRAAGFVWHRDSLWAGLESTFVKARPSACEDSARWGRAISGLDVIIDVSTGTSLSPSAPVLDTLESRFFRLAPHVAACPSLVERYVALYARMRRAIKWQSRSWDVNSVAARDRLYRSLYGGRAAVEEVLLQVAAGSVPVFRDSLAPSATPAALSHGVELHSGDIIVSRGGYPTSALIARGNDYPGNFSHVALVQIDERTHEISVIEAHIEVGVAISSFDHYLSDKKLRLMLLRPRADLPELHADPMLPHRAATAMLERARAGHIPYDFAMDYHDPSRLFCSEVASSAYHDRGVDLWMGISTISSPGLRRWLGSFGVEHFETEEPSDLEYDPQLIVAAEWRDGDALYLDHIGNAVTDIMLEGAERGEEIAFPWYALPPARLAKGYSWVVERFGRIGPIPEGMSAAAALRNRSYSARHAMLTAEVEASAARWTKEHGYRPPYWILLALARTAAGSPPPVNPR